MTRKLLLVAATATLVLAAAGAALAVDPTARDAALRDLGFAPSDCRDFQTHGEQALVCVKEVGNQTAEDADDHHAARGDVDAQGDHDDQGGDRDDHATPASSFRVANGSVTGRHVAFHVDATNAVVTGYASLGPWANGVVFQSLSISHDNASKATVRGYGFALSNDDWTWRAFDQADAHWTFAAKENATVALVLGPDENATVGAGGKVVEIHHDGRLATLRLMGSDAHATLSGATLTLTVPAHDGAQFRIAPAHGSEAGEHAAPAGREPRSEPAKPVPRPEDGDDS
jgi:hypothetical protein